jgi:hypothetical protein
MNTATTLESMSAAELKAIQKNVESIVAEHGKHRVRSLRIFLQVTTEAFMVEQLRRRWDRCRNLAAVAPTR